MTDKGKVSILSRRLICGVNIIESNFNSAKGANILSFRHPLTYTGSVIKMAIVACESRNEVILLKMFHANRATLLTFVYVSRVKSLF
jgi:hypothetical protein